MAHVRTQLRNALKAALIAAGTNAGARVFTSRLRKIGADDLPCLVVMTPEEPDARRAFAGQHAPARLERDVVVVIEAIVKYADGAEDAVDTLLAQVEAALHADRVAATLGGLIPKGLWPTQFNADEDQLEVRVFSGRQAFAGSYSHQSNAPETAL